MLHDLRFPGPDHDDGPFRGAHGEGFEIIVQKEHVPFKHCRHGRVAANRPRRVIVGSPVMPPYAKKITLLRKFNHFPPYSQVRMKAFTVSQLYKQYLSVSARAMA
jgi:hypothetical protein